jgi:homoserine O-acetyltransferase
LSYQQFKYSHLFTLESGRTLPGFHLAYTTYGKLNEAKDNVVWVFHALTANSDPQDWWSGLIGTARLFDPEEYFIVCANMPGSHYGSINPLDMNFETGESYYHGFPVFTIRDMVKAYQHLKVHLGIDKIYIGLGGSMGGQQLLEWAIDEPSLFQFIIPIATNAQHSPWGIAFNASQRWCIENDQTWKNKMPNAGLEGLKIARSIALLSYRNYFTYNEAQKGVVAATKDEGIDHQLFKADTYQHHQGEKLAKRFNAFSYYFLSKSMDTHDVGRDRKSVEQALEIIIAKTLVIGISSDILFPITEQKYLAENIPYAQLSIIHSNYGHDGFLLEYEQIEEAIKEFIIIQKETSYSTVLPNNQYKRELKYF